MTRIKTEREYWEAKAKIAQFHLALLSAQEDEEICPDMRDLYVQSMTTQIENLNIETWHYEQIKAKTPR